MIRASRSYYAKASNDRAAEDAYRAEILQRFFERVIFFPV